MKWNNSLFILLLIGGVASAGGLLDSFGGDFNWGKEIQRPVPDLDQKESNKIISEITRSAPPPVVNNGECNDAAESYRLRDVKPRQRVVDKCLTSIMPANSHYLESVVKRVVYISNSKKNSPDRCTGILISRDKVLTAGHCSAAKVFVFSGAGMKVLERTPCEKQGLANCDYAVLKIEQVTFEIPDVTFESTTKGHKLWIPGYAVTDIAGDPDVIPPLKWPVSSYQGCLVQYLSKGCLIHYCPIMSGYSGAPIVDMEKSAAEGRAVVVGLHTTSDLKSSGCVADMKVSSLSANFGTPISDIKID
ncbi:trypsin-like serine peptidase [Pseudomonas citronellolis]|uniref:trypsin-like serine peptidase n=1 Tax=Pseudomonas citronellolis TaxID=53408 RepID=UPI0022BA1927|nr:serine protease [Pseudomonas citronellolis]WBG63188.1 serine protease [Pseudomonas citronellolis]